MRIVASRGYFWRCFAPRGVYLSSEKLDDFKNSVDFLHNAQNLGDG